MDTIFSLQVNFLSSGMQLQLMQLQTDKTNNCLTTNNCFSFKKYSTSSYPQKLSDLYIKLLKYIMQTISKLEETYSIKSVTYVS